MHTKLYYRNRPSCAFHNTLTSFFTHIIFTSFYTPGWRTTVVKTAIIYTTFFTSKKEPFFSSLQNIYPKTRCGFIIKILLRRPSRFFAMWHHIFASFLCSKELSNLAQTLEYICFQQDFRPCWVQNINFKQNRTTFYYIKSLQKYEATSQKDEKVSLNGF